MPLSTPNTPPSAPANPASRQPELRDFLRLMVKESASDLVLKAGGCPAVRVAGSVRFLGDQPLPAALVRSRVRRARPESAGDAHSKGERSNCHPRGTDKHTPKPTPAWPK